ncbi:hypothetical protein CH373_02345 [Leptospira perolatii]|uniref:ComEC/Rec2-related protein domain-containing protein n=1 Tax=Leptospira perolatii TaxID=2023191 RepID=A0A2M9ZS55_9LEPT|nr:ComEC/Rec2 family competence protein [Leptospira perolatii]PJZ71358.1 hypothetical protein CH360_02345 [Leptospira perolatii]PJZ74892.1 hypothetical protein CH373_02345 [Leptospira perolatii]
MISEIEKQFRDWIPISLVSYFAIGYFSCLSLDLILPNLLIFWCSAACLGLAYLLIQNSPRNDSRKKLSTVCIGILFFLAQDLSQARRHEAPFLKDSEILKQKSGQFVNHLLDEADISGIDRDISLGLVLGDSKGLDPDFKRAAQEGGILHLFAASGLHLGILLGSIFFCLKKFPKLGYYFPIIFPVGFGFAFLACLGFPMSLCRAWVFSSLLLLQSLVFRKLRISDLLLFTAFILYLWDPVRSFGVSFLLSFGAVIGIFLLRNCFAVLIPFSNRENSWKTTVLRFMRENLLISMSAGLGTFPALVWYFGSYSFGSLFLNLLLVPLCGVLLPILYLAILLQSMGIPYFCELAWWSAKLLLFLLVEITRFWSDSELGILCSYFREAKILSLALFSSLILFLCYTKVLLSKDRSVKLHAEQGSLNLYLETSSGEDSLSQAAARRKNSALRKFFRSLFASGFALILYLSLYFSSKWTPPPPLFFGDRFSFVIRNQGTLEIAGKCKYSNRLYYSTFVRKREFVCGNLAYSKNEERTFPIREIYLEDESCFKWIASCIKGRSNVSIFYAGKDFENSDSYSDWNMQKTERRSWFYLPNPSGPKRLIRFRLGKDRVASLVRETRDQEGLILLLPRYKQTADIYRWNQNRKQLGIGPGWRFIGSNEIPGVPIL